MSRKANQALILAAERSDLEGVQAAVAEGAAINCPDEVEGYTALHHAALNGNYVAQPFTSNNSQLFAVVVCLV